MVCHLSDFEPIFKSPLTHHYWEHNESYFANSTFSGTMLTNNSSPSFRRDRYWGVILPLYSLRKTPMCTTLSSTSYVSSDKPQKITVSQLTFILTINDIISGFGQCHSRWCNDIIITSWWARWRLKSPASQLLTQPFIQAQIKENIKASSLVTDEFPAQRACNAVNVSIWWRHQDLLPCDVINIDDMKSSSAGPIKIWRTHTSPCPQMYIDG